MLELKNISKSFGSKKVINSLDLIIPDGSILAIVGPSGGGKTTLLRTLAGLETVDSGDFLLDGEKFDPVNSKHQEQVVGVVFQEFELFPHLSVFENIVLAPKLALKEEKDAYTKKAEDIAAQLGIESLMQQYPYQLSGGQKQRVAIARAMAMDPKVLAYDEPTSALDPALREHVEQIILGLKQQGVTQLVVTHDMTFAENIADNLLEVEEIK
ncbi:MAG: ATP-binding cassette domain-containing protein [Tetragenococcus halophilus]|uniref:Amino acid ABC transporter ATP-binding protein n=2 Tax=Tetragenococcus halophilus TaxID=51669 RepID=A0A3G5FLU7_TETHA|nr:ATP-binding cassette domain-containing protein [Tetragenococcus halophilus]MDN6195686.1 ATP-binding cassette domain-containing protein [Atopostipes suicloacalis]AYW51332.1 amino acid ABC transporter ATP-binding protein [Tetragenococcus halophilus]MCO7026972.1 ATP-binding cassette domain-containing protein [Tetragenococcus halophilus]MCO8285182.1 amino acid ABC transporter ATP-binding protein [Tetragenococcus halophilus]MCO8285838.1 amino acid ABC transporter ATP-binding protein [Tetragenoco